MVGPLHVCMYVCVGVQVVWSTASREAEDLLLSRGTIIERLEDKVFQFETFRMPWENEKGRRSSEAETALTAGLLLSANNKSN